MTACRWGCCSVCCASWRTGCVRRCGRGMMRMGSRRGISFRKGRCIS
ncbi:hypothetical protein GMO_24850 [Gluconobacter morbifer G707]|uniref:Uncharacterized protein n=1 Tax=Gluconobacter morbifer G707 TaxID=1088869 RepID=G6XL62_9PROT|nr:hypothetical protein GMO_24850 [Gluconobacter morbifer G707]